MSTRFKSLAAILCLAGVISQPTFAAAAPTTVEKKLARLESEVQALKSQLNTSRRINTFIRSNPGVKNSNKLGPPLPHRGYESIPGEVNQQPLVGEPETQAALTRMEIMRTIGEQRDYLPFDLDVPGQAFVSTGPYVGVPIQYSGTDLIINSPSVNTDLQLLTIRKSIIRQLRALGGPFLSQDRKMSHLLLSGLVENQANYTNIGGKPSTTDIDVTNVSIDFIFLGPSDWTLGYVELTYDNGLLPGTPVNFFRTFNSRVFVNKAFITIGNLDCSPFYFTAGQYFVPFGAYSSVMVSDTLTKDVARTKARALQFSFAQQETKFPLFGAVYIFRGDSHANSVAKVNNGGVNLGWQFETKCISGKIGGGWIANIADSSGMQLGNGFAFDEQLHHRVPGWNARGGLSLFKHLDLIAEWVSAASQFNVNDMMYNNHGATPSAFDLEAAFSFSAFDKPSSIGVGYDKSNEALSLGIPLKRYFVVLNTSIWRNTLQSLEFRHDRNYAASDIANGPNGVINGTCTAFTCSSTGKSDNAVTAQFDYYF